MVAVGPCVLVLEDSVLVAMAIEAALNERGIASVLAGSIAAAAERVSGRRPAAALLDIRLPDGDSLELAFRLQSEGCAIAFVTGSDSGEPPEGAPEGCAWFRKPVGAEVLARWAQERIAAHPG